MKTLTEWLAYQERLHPSAIALGLDRVREVAARLGLPAAGIRTVTVGGTNGKGSSTALLAGIYRAAGYRVGAYSSPHLFHYAERVQIDGVAASDAALCAAFDAIEAARGPVPITYFEFGTLAALWLFAQAQLDVQVLEVGLGGRLDAVNLVDADAALVTNIGLDHQDWLGHTLDAIGAEKAGIFRPQRPAICAEPRTCQGLVAAGASIGAGLIRRDLGDFDWQLQRQGWSWQRRGAAALEQLPLPALAGRHQLDNAAGVLATVEALQAVLPVARSAVDSALRALSLPGRLQWHGRFLLDVGHNAEAAKVQADYLQTLPKGQPALWLVGMLEDKPAERVAEALAGPIGQAFCFTLPPPRGLSAAVLAKRLTAGGIAATAFASPEAALLAATALASENQIILVSGSFQTVAAIAPLLARP